MATHKCDHHHTYLAHPQCYKAGREERVGFFDIESGGGGFTADGAFVICYCILDDKTDEITQSIITPHEIRKYGPKGHEDYGLMKRLNADLRKFDRVVTYNGTNFDTKFCRTRALSMGLDFPVYGTIKHTDVYFMAKSRLALRRKSQESVGRCLFGNEGIEKNHFDVSVWRHAIRGHQPSLDQILDHCQRDVRDLKKTFHKLVAFGRPPSDNSM